VWIAAGLLACRDPAGVGLVSTNAFAQAITPRLIVSDSDATTAVVTLALAVPGTVGRIGSFTGQITYDSTALTFVAEVSINDGALRALNPSTGLVRIAGASVQGLNPSQLISLRFRIRDPSALARIQFDLEELHESSAANLKKLVQPQPPGRRP
jgi:hypothetical protein